MSYIYVYGPNEDSNDYSTMGLVGALTPTICTFREVANGESQVTLKHPLDTFGRYTALVSGNILSVPVPVRTTPEIQNGSCVTTVWTYKVKPLNQLTSKYQRALYKRKSGSSRKKIMKPGDIVTVVLKPEDTEDTKRWKVKSEYGTGWINPDGFELVTQHSIPDNSEAIMEIQSPWKVTEQYFRIYKVDKTMTEVTVSARHITYDLLYNLTRYSSEETVTLQTALDGILSRCYNEHPFSAYTNVENTQPGIFYDIKNPIDAFLNPEEGICKKYDVGIVRDNYEMYFLHDPGTNRGVRIEYGKNMTGISFSSSEDEVATRIIPIGETKDGEPLFISTEHRQQHIDSPRINDYPVVHVYELRCENCKVGDKDENGGKITKEVAIARMIDQANKLIENGCDKPKIEMSVEFINLGDTEEYQQFKDLENCFLYDYIIVQHPQLGIDVTSQIMEIEWDCLLERMNSVVIGSVGKTFANTGLTTWQIPAGFSGSKIADGTLGNSALQNGIIATRHLQAESINTEALQAQSVTAEKIAAGSITAEHIQAGAITAEKIIAGAITADKIAAGAITADKIAANTITADKIQAGAINATHIQSKTITAEQIAAGTITADSGIIGAGAIGTAQIADGSITDAKVIDLSANSITAGTLSVERLIIMGSDKSIVYKVNELNGTPQLSKDTIDGGSLTQRTITADRIVAGAITAREIASKTITANNILAETITAAEIAASTITASRLNVDEIFADDVFTNALTTSRIFADGGTLTIVASNANEAKSESASAINAASSASVTADEAKNLAENALPEEEFKRLVRVDAEGLHVGDNQTSNELLLDSGALHVKVNGVVYTRLGAKYLDLGDEIRMRRPTVGGLVFSPIRKG